MDESKVVQSINEITDPLSNVYNSLCKIKCKAIADGSILDLLRRAHAFGLNLAKLDIRQESSRHQKLLKKVFQKNLEYQRMLIRFRIFLNLIMLQ